MDYETFTSNLSNLERYRSSLETIERELIEYSSGENDSHRASKSAEIGRSYELKYLELTFTESAIRLIEEILFRMPEEIQTILKEIYIQKIPYKKVGMKYGYTDCGLWKMLRRETEKYL